MTKQYDNFADLITFTRASTGTALRRVGYGSELVTNGAFDTNVSGWTAVNAVISASSGQLVVDDTLNAGADSRAQQDITTIVGGVYKLSFDRISTTTSFGYAVGTTSTFASISYNGALGAGTGELIVYFVATAITTRVSVISGSNGVTAYDNISVKEVIFDRATDPLVLFNHPTNVPRIEYDINGNRKGLLIEEARTNLILQSGNLAVSPWTAINVTTSVDASTAPNGSDMTLLTSTGVNSDTAVNQNTISSAGTTYTASVFVRRDQHRFAILFGFGNGGTGVVFDLVLGTAQVNGSWVSAGIDIISPTIARIYGVVTPVLSNAGLFVGLASTINGDKFFSGGEALSFWGAQLEAGSFPTSYIPTAGSTATRAADAASIPTSAFGYNADKGTVVVDYSTFTAEGTTRIVELESDNENRVTIFQGAIGEQVDLFVRLGGVEVVNTRTANVATSGDNTIAAVYAENDFAITLNGGVLVTDTSATVPPVDNLMLGRSNVAGVLNGHIKSIQYYPRRLTNAQLQRLTS